MWWTRNQVLREFVRLSEILHEKEHEGVITHDEAASAIDKYRQRADELLSALKHAQVVNA